MAEIHRSGIPSVYVMLPNFCAGIFISFAGRLKITTVGDVFDRPGECDLTANVDFGYIKEAMG